MTAVIDEARPQRASLYNDPKIRSRVAQVIFLLLLVWVGYEIFVNTSANLAKLGIKGVGFGFLQNTAGFDIIQTPIEYTSQSSFFLAIVVGFINTLIVAALGIIFATLIGFVIGIMRLSSNWLIAKVATGYVEIIRNIPLLLQMLFWYTAVLKPLPNPKESLSIFGFAFLSNRGLIVPKAIWSDGAGFVGIAFIAGCIGAFAISRWARQRQARTGEQFPSFLAGLGAIIGLPLIAFILAGAPVTFEYPVFKGFNFTGGTTILPELIALLLALSIYTASFIAEIVRAGILAVSHGQTEAAHALGLRSQPTLRLVIIPQALRVIIPPLTSQYLNLTKNSSLAVAIGYPDLVAMGGVVMNQTGRAVEIVLIWMTVYLSVSLVTSGFMNWFNARVRLVER